MHYGRVDEVHVLRQSVMNRIYKLHPERFVKGPTKVKKPDEKVWINKPGESIEEFKNVA